MRRCRFVLTSLCSRLCFISNLKHCGEKRWTCEIRLMVVNRQKGGVNTLTFSLRLTPPIILLTKPLTRPCSDHDSLDRVWHRVLENCPFQPDIVCGLFWASENTHPDYFIVLLRVIWTEAAFWQVPFFVTEKQSTSTKLEHLPLCPDIPSSNYLFI